METIRQYAQERLAEREERAVRRQRHLDYFLALGEEAFAAAWDEGRAMPLEQAIDYALQEQTDL